MESQGSSEIRERRQQQPPDDQGHRDDVPEAERGWMQRFKEDSTSTFIKNLIYEIYLRLTSSDFIWQSLIGVKKCFLEAPCSTVLYVSLVVFGFLPIICFFLFVCGTFILWMVCFIFFQALAVALAGAVCAVMFLFIVAASCAVATSCGCTVHVLAFLGEVYRVLAFNAPEAVSYIREKLGKLGIHLRLPQDDQA